jgi:hypothetical protein
MWRREDSIRFHEQRRLLYARLLSTLDELSQDDLSIDLAGQIRTLWQIKSEIDLVATEPVRSAANALSGHVTLYHSNAANPSAKQVVLERFICSREEFLHAVRSELGIP